jgi:predicted RNA-binding Zn-ribbon protein involved in translation (DUF1610 family)
MSTVFEYPCPGCGLHMDVRSDGDVECPACDRRYHARMGYLLPMPRCGSEDTPAAAGGLTTGGRS